MPRIKGLSKEEASEEMKPMFEQQEQRYGKALNNAAIYALRPTIRKGVEALAQGIEQSGLIEPDLRHLLCLKTASINGCPY
jgi:hypothetical protein